MLAGILHGSQSLLLFLHHSRHISSILRTSLPTPFPQSIRYFMEKSFQRCILFHPEHIQLVQRNSVPNMCPLSLSSLSTGIQTFSPNTIVLKVTPCVLSTGGYVFRLL
ncbi:unnamed protein product [Laminaria digitata]